MPRKGENIRRRKDGRWEGRFYVPCPSSRKKISRSVYAKTYAEVKKKLAAAKVEAVKMPALHSMGTEISGQDYSGLYKITGQDQADGEVQAGQADQTGATFDSIASDWLAVVAERRKYSTYIKYRDIYKTHLHPILSGMSVKDMDRDTAYQLTQSIETKSESLTKSIYCVLNQLSKYVTNTLRLSLPAISPDKAATSTKPVETLAQAEQIRLLTFLYEEMDLSKFGIVLCLSTGLRLGEVCALKWSDIDLDGMLLYVKRTVQRISVEGQGRKTILLEGEPKSVFSKREIPLPDNIVSLIKHYHSNRGYVISGNKPTEPRTYQNRFHKYLELAGINRRNFHVLRNTFATNCVNSGADVKSLSEILGHSDVRITLNRYVHPSMEIKRQHLNSLSAIYGQYVGQQ